MHNHKRRIMQALIILTEPQPRKRKPKTKKEVYSVTYRLSPPVKFAISELAELFGRSENLQVEYSLKTAYLHSKGVNIYRMSELDIVEKFDELTRHFEKDTNAD